ncbi:MAG: outer membrane lipoprotein-sorting protein [Pseudomonadota bacterium]
MASLPLLFLAGLLTLVATAGAEEITARAVMEKVDARDDGDRSTADMTMVLIDRHGRQRSRSIRSFSLDKGDDTCSLMYFLTPADVAGTGFLTCDYKEAAREDDQWLYLPALKKTKRIAASDKSGSFMGSDFTYADMTRRRLDDYTYTFNKEQAVATVYDQKTWVIDSLPHNPQVIEETGYARSILFVRQDNFMVVRAIHFVDKGGELKYFDVKKMALIDNIWTSLEIHMTRKKGGNTIHQTILTLDDVRYNQKTVDDSLFTIRSLEKGL